ncbi:MAG: hypothetical protein J7M15_03300 [Anaerolineae bacterium]|nr:hypothetical protein [Anaerolineae bacterium]
MDDPVRRIQVWASHGTLRQFFTELNAKLVNLDAQCELEGNTITCYRVTKSGGFLGIGARKVKTPLLKLTKEGDQISVAEDPLDREFVSQLAAGFKAH